MKPDRQSNLTPERLFSNDKKIGLLRTKAINFTYLILFIK